MKIYSAKDVDQKALKGAIITIIGYGSQGRAHALNLKDSGATELVVALRPGSAGVAKAEAAGKTTKEYAAEKSDAPGALGKEARLAENLMGMSHKKSAKAKLYGKG